MNCQIMKLRGIIEDNRITALNFTFRIKQNVDEYINDTSKDSSFVYSDFRKISKAFQILKVKNVFFSFTYLLLPGLCN